MPADRDAVRPTADADGIVVRALREADVAVLEAAEPAGRGFTRAMWEQQVAGACTLLVAWRGGAPVGSGQVVWSDPAELKNLTVDAGERGRGTGTRIVASAEELVGSGRDLSIGVALDNPRAAALYARLGYHDTGATTTTTYTYVDDSGVHRTTTETDTTLLKNL